MKQADFSANNIGRVATMSELTKKTLSKQTQYSIDSQEAVALDNFLAAMTAGGFIGGDNPKLSVLMIPALASGHDDLFYNICKLDANGAPTNWMPATETEDPAYAVYQDGGHNIGAYPTKVVTDSLALNGFDLNLGSFFARNQKMPSFASFNYLCMSFSTGNRQISGYFNSTGIKHSASDCFAGIVNSTRATFTTEQTATPKGFYGMAYDADSGAIIINNNGITQGTSTPVSGGVTLGNSIGYVNTSYALLWGNSNPIGATHSSIIGFGPGLTQEELATIKGLCDTLAAALHITI